MYSQYIETRIDTPPPNVLSIIYSPEEREDMSSALQNFIHNHETPTGKYSPLAHLTQQTQRDLMIALPLTWPLTNTRMPNEGHMLEDLYTASLLSADMLAFCKYIRTHYTGWLPKQKGVTIPLWQKRCPSHQREQLTALTKGLGRYMNDELYEDIVPQYEDIPSQRTEIVINCINMTTCGTDSFGLMFALDTTYSWVHLTLHVDGKDQERIRVTFPTTPHSSMELLRKMFANRPVEQLLQWDAEEVQLSDLYMQLIS